MRDDLSPPISLFIMDKEHFTINPGQAYLEIWKVRTTSRPEWQHFDLAGEALTAAIAQAARAQRGLRISAVAVQLMAQQLKLEAPAPVKAKGARFTIMRPPNPGYGTLLILLPPTPTQATTPSKIIMEVLAVANQTGTDCSIDADACQRLAEMMKA